MNAFARLLVASICLAAPAAVRADTRDDEIFGAAPAAPAKPAPPGQPAALDANAAKLVDSLQIGGRLEVRADAGQAEETQLPGTGFGQLKQADVYFDTRPSKDLRGFLRARFTEASGSDAPAGAPPGTRTDLDEMWFKWGMRDTVYATFGKQHVKWGSGFFWNPTDFTAPGIKDPFAPFDRRLGTEMLKLHMPFEKRGYNVYALLQYADATQVEQVSGALRGEFAFGGIGEVALTVQDRSHAPLRVGADVSSGLGPLDVHWETAATQREDRLFYSGDVDPATSRLPESRQADQEKWFVQSVVGLEHGFKYTDNNSVTLGAEYFYNQLGYDDRDLELYSLVMGQSPPLYSGSHYAGVYVLLPYPFSWTETTFNLSGIRNLSDETSVVRLSGSWLLHKDATIDGFVGRCQGDYGELCFRVPGKFTALAADPRLTMPQRQAVAALPTKRVQTTAGVGITLKF